MHGLTRRFTRPRTAPRPASGVLGGYTVRPRKFPRLSWEFDLRLDKGGRKLRDGHVVGNGFG